MASTLFARHLNREEVNECMTYNRNSTFEIEIRFSPVWRIRKVAEPGAGMRHIPTHESLHGELALQLGIARADRKSQSRYHSSK